jgi:hypothetical protein
MMNRVISKDGTSIACERLGRGPAVIMVAGGLDDGSENAPLAREPAKHFTVYNYARRGRGDSGDTLPYAMERTIPPKPRPNSNARTSKGWTLC